VIVWRVLQLAGLRLRSHEWKELEIVVLRHELAILSAPNSSPDHHRRRPDFLAAAGRLLSRNRWPSFIVTSATLLRWHRRLVAKRWTHVRPAGRTPLRREMREMALRLAHDNPRWGYQRIVGEPHQRRTGHPDWSGARIQRRVRLGGVIHEYDLAA